MHCKHCMEKKQTKYLNNKKFSDGRIKASKT